ncbi:unnamed protein product [Closterium sp. Naga37s-1]|nr:unnamed protein product [Closterium sp. Naga37s-1]
MTCIGEFNVVCPRYPLVITTTPPPAEPAHRKSGGGYRGVRACACAELAGGKLVEDGFRPGLVGGLLARERVLAIVAGRYFTLAITQHGRLFTWGIPPASSPHPPAMFTSTTRRQPGGGGMHRGLLTLNSAFHASVPSGASAGAGGNTSADEFALVMRVGGVLRRVGVSKVAASGHTLVVTPGGVVLSWGRDWDARRRPAGLLGRADGAFWRPAPVEGLTGEGQVVAVETGQYHSVAVMESGRVFTWGLNNRGQLGRPIKSKVRRAVGRRGGVEGRRGGRGEGWEGERGG